MSILPTISNCKNIWNNYGMSVHVSVCYSPAFSSGDEEDDDILLRCHACCVFLEGVDAN